MAEIVAEKLATRKTKMKEPNSRISEMVYAINCLVTRLFLLHLQLILGLKWRFSQIMSVGSEASSN